MERLVINGEELMGKSITHLNDNNQLEFEMCDDDLGDAEVMATIVTGILDTVSDAIGAALATGEEEVEVNLFERLTIIGSVRENEDGVKNMSLSIVPGSEMKKRIKNDAGLTD